MAARTSVALFICLVVVREQAAAFRTRHRWVPKKITLASSSAASGGRAPGLQEVPSRQAAQHDVAAGLQAIAMPAAMATADSRSSGSSSSGGGASVAGPLAWFQAQVGSGVQQFRTNPAETVGILFTIMIFIYSLKIHCIDWPVAARAAKKMEHMRKDMNEFYDKKFAEVFVSLQAIQEDTALLAVRHFQSNFRSMITYMKNLTSIWVGDDLMPDPAWVARFRAFVLVWMQIFQQCSFDPVKQPLMLCSPEALEHATSVSEIATIVIKEAGEKMDFELHLLSTAKALRDSIEADKKNLVTRSEAWATLTCTTFGWTSKKEAALLPATLHLVFVKISIASEWQAWLLLALAYAFLLAVFLHLRAQLLIGACLDVAVFMLLMLLAKANVLEEHVRLEHEFDKLQEKKQEMATIRAGIQKRAEQQAAVCNLWLYQTMNLLDLWEELKVLTEKTMNNKRMASKQTEWAALTKVFQTGMEVSQGLLSTSMYMGPGALDEELLQSAGADMKQSIDKIAKAVDRLDLQALQQHLDNFFCFLHVRIVTVHGLPAADQTSVIMKVGDAPEFQRRTQVLAADVGGEPPWWNEELSLRPLPASESAVSLEVRGLDAGGYYAVRTETVLGSASLRFRIRPGEWVSRRLKLQSASGKPLKGVELEVKVFYGTCINHYKGLNAGSASRNKRLLTTMPSMDTFLKRGQGGATFVRVDTPE